MSKSLDRVRAALIAANLDPDIRETELSRTAEDAAKALGCSVDQIAKSIIFRGETSDRVLLFLTAGGNKVDGERAAALAGEPLGKADAALIRSQTGFAIGGVAPVGHLSPIRAYMDPRLSDFDIVWAAAGTPRHVFPVSPTDLMRISQALTGDFTTV
jgi:prolyl-tRNA editing enzyme YbaK/EbsC (Cys-tRNA(Pro) deacylase)